MQTLWLMGRSVLMIAALALCAAIARADTLLTLGRDTVGTIASSGMSANFKRASKFTLSENGTLYQMCAYVDGNGGGTGRQDLRLFIYRDNNGVPGDVMYAPLQTLGIDQGTAADWQCVWTFGLPIAPGNYWVGIQSSGNAGVARYFYDGPADWYGAADSYGDGVSRTFGSGSAGAGTITVKAVYRQGLQFTLGRQTVGTTMSSPATADMKRGSSFTLTRPAQFEQVFVYLDGLGATSGDQAARVTIYRDDNGVPGERVADGGETRIYAGMPPTWQYFYVASDGVPAGKYWLVLHTGGTSGVIRYYMDGTGNWYGNTDTYADGSSRRFGAGTPGNGTISAFATYHTGMFTHGRKSGRTDVATKASNPMTADFIRASAFHMDGQGVATALCAYLDGRGGAPGSQQLRMVLFFDVDESDMDYWVIPSDVVTIAAGTPASWLCFPIPYTYLPPGSYDLAIMSGPGNGVARYYVDGSETNWTGLNYPFTAEPPSYYQRAGYSSGTISEYIEYTTQDSN